MAHRTEQSSGLKNASWHSFSDSGNIFARYPAHAGLQKPVKAEILVLEK